MPSPRSRYGNVVHLDDVPWETYPTPDGGTWARSREVAQAIGARDLGYSVVHLEPGKASCPFHFHHSEEEMFHVLSGQGILRQGDGEGPDERVEVRAGDTIAFPPGTRIAHSFENTSDAPLVYLALSNRLPHDVAEYPDSDKVLIRGTRLMLRRTPKLEYLDGEDAFLAGCAPESPAQ